MVVAAWRPSIRCVALRAVRTEARLGVVGFHRAGVVRHVAGVTVRGRIGVARRVALDAVHVHVHTRQREARGVVVERGVTPRALVVAQCAVRWEARRNVVGVRGGVVFRQVTTLTGIRCIDVARCMALVAVHVRVRAVQREACG